MEPLPAVRPTIRNLFLWLFVAVPLLVCATNGMEDSATPLAGEMNTQELLRDGPSGRSRTEDFGTAHRAPAVMPGLVTREIYLPIFLMRTPGNYQPTL